MLANLSAIVCPLSDIFEHFKMGELMVLKLPRSDYLTACARIRGITPTSLVRRLIRIIEADQLVASILDDEGDMKVRHKHETRYREA